MIPAKLNHDLLVVKEACALLRINERTIRRWMVDGKIKFMRLPGGRIRFTRNAVMESLDRSFDEEKLDRPDPSMG